MLTRRFTPAAVLAPLAFAAGCSHTPQQDQQPTNDTHVPLELQEQIEDLKAALPWLFANTRLVGATALNLDENGDLADGVVIAQIQNFDCSIADEVQKQLDKNPAIKIDEHIDAFLKSLVHNNIGVIRDVTESGIEYEFTVRCDGFEALTLDAI